MAEASVVAPRPRRYTSGAGVRGHTIAQPRRGTWLDYKRAVHGSGERGPRPKVPGPVSPWRVIVPNLLTLVGLVAGLAGVLLYPAALGVLLLVASLGCDFLDGWSARRLGGQTRFGEAFDIACDSAISLALVWRVFSPATAAVLTAALVLLHTVGRVTRRRLSGRIPTTAIALLAAL